MRQLFLILALMVVACGDIDEPIENDETEIAHIEQALTNAPFALLTNLTLPSGWSTAGGVVWVRTSTATANPAVFAPANPNTYAIGTGTGIASTPIAAGHSCYPMSSGAWFTCYQSGGVNPYSVYCPANVYPDGTRWYKTSAGSAWTPVGSQWPLTYTPVGSSISNEKSVTANSLRCVYRWTASYSPHRIYASNP